MDSKIAAMKKVMKVTKVKITPDRPALQILKTSNLTSIEGRCPNFLGKFELVEVLRLKSFRRSCSRMSMCFGKERNPEHEYYSKFKILNNFLNFSMRGSEGVGRRLWIVAHNGIAFPSGKYKLMGSSNL
jgi:hypothetical protein